MPGRAALDLALPEITLHRCDIALALGLPTTIYSGPARAIASLVATWLLLVAPDEPVPSEPVRYGLTDGSAEWYFRFDGQRWSADECTEGTRTVVGRGRTERLVLGLAGRLPLDLAVEEASDKAELRALKAYLPGP